MKTEKELNPQKTAAETESQKLDKPLDEVELEDTKNELLLSLKKMIDQGAAMLDFQKDENGEVESVTITRTLTGEMLFHADNKGWTGRADIKRTLNLLNSERPD